MENVRQKNWFGRNWLWALPVGGCLTIIFLLVFGIGALFFGVTKAINDSAPIEYAMEQIENNTELKNILGTHIEIDGMFNGNLSLNDDDGTVDISIPVSGKKGSGILIIKGEKQDGVWFYEDLYVKIKDSNEKIILLDQTFEGI